MTMPYGAIQTSLAHPSLAVPIRERKQGEKDDVRGTTRRSISYPGRLLEGKQGEARDERHLIESDSPGHTDGKTKHPPEFSAWARTVYSKADRAFILFYSGRGWLCKQRMEMLCYEII
jgi:hypothetical protein